MQAESNDDTKKWLKESLILCLAGFILVTCWVSLNHAFLVAGCVMPCALVWLIVLLRNKRKRDPRRRMLMLIAALVLISSGPTGCAVGLKRTKDRIESLIEPLEMYRNIHGKYPADLKSLHISPPACIAIEKQLVLYVPDQQRQSYSLTCNTYIFTKLSYRSQTGEWVEWD